jgi:hypothetical protein
LVFARRKHTPHNSRNPQWGHFIFLPVEVERSECIGIAVLGRK